MKKTVFGLAAVGVICACGLVIDPDKLVEGNGVIDGTDAGDATAAETSTTTDAGADTSDLDASLEDGGDGGMIIPAVPDCVPVKPTTAEGPYAVVIAASGVATPACPAGYLATPVAVAKTDFEALAVECNDTTSCSCANSGGTPSCGMKMGYYSDSACTKVADSPTNVTTNCNSIESENYYKLDLNIGGFTCTSNGALTTAPSLKPPAAYKTQFVVCAPDPNVQLTQCKAGEVGLPATADASACIIVPNAVSCTGTGYGATRFLSKAGTVSDTRACNCSCALSPSSCAGGSAIGYDNPGCAGDTSAFTIGTCQARDSEDSVIGTMPAPGTAMCLTRATAGGSASGNFDTKLCCLGGG